MVTTPTGEHINFPAVGSRDALCARIGSEVNEISAVDGGELRVRFADEAIIATSLTHQGRQTLEVLHFFNASTGETQWW
jgi:hypothetical protein